MAAFCGARNKQFEVGIVARKDACTNGKLHVFAVDSASRETQNLVWSNFWRYETSRKGYAPFAAQLGFGHKIVG